MAAKTYSKIKLNTYPVLDAEDYLRTLSARPWWADEINSIFCPVGPRPGFAMFLVSTATTNALDQNSDVSINWTYNLEGGGEVERNFQGYKVIAAWDAADVVDGCRVIKLADARSKMNREEVVKRYNVRRAIGNHWDPDTLKTEDPHTWAEMVEDLVANADPNFTLDKNPDDNTDPDPPNDPAPIVPENWVFIGRPVLECLEEICVQTENVLFLDPLKDPSIDGQLKSGEVGTSQPDLSSLLARPEHRNANPTPCGHGVAPSDIKVLFHWRPGAGDSWNPRPPVEVDVASEILNAAPNTFATVWGTRLAEPDLTAEDSAPPTNQTELTNEAERIKPRIADYWTTFSEPKMIRFAGVQVIAPGVEIGSVRWFVGPGGAAWTEIRYAEPDPPLVRQKPEPGSFPRSSAGWVAKVPIGGIDAIQGDDPGSADCEIYRLDDNGTLVGVDDTKDAPVKAKVYNMGTDSIEEGASGTEPNYIPLLRDWEGKFWALAPGGGEQNPPPFVYFTLLNAIDPNTNKGDAQVLYDTSENKDPGDPITVWDPNFIFLDLPAGASGFAVRAKKTINDNPDAPLGGGTGDENVYQIINAQRNIEKYRVQLGDTDLFGSNQPIINWTNPLNRGVLPNYLAEPSSPPQIENPLLIDCMKEGFIWIARYWVPPMEAGNRRYERAWYVVDSEKPKARELNLRIQTIQSGTTWAVTTEGFANGFDPGLSVFDFSGVPLYRRPEEGDLIQVHYDANTNGYFYVNELDYRALWVYGSFTIAADGQPQNSQMTVEFYWDGWNPGSTVNVRFPGSAGIAAAGCTSGSIAMKGFARYRREDQRYVIIGTDSGLLGAPTAKDVPTGPMQPSGTGSGGGSPDPCADDTGTYCFEQETRKQLVFEPCGEPADEDKTYSDTLCIDVGALMDCVDICEYICENCDEYGKRIECEDPPPPGDCCYDCEFTSLDDVSLDDGSNMVSATAKNACCWDVDVSGGDGGGRTVEVCYNGGGNWTVDGKQLTDGSCAGASDGAGNSVSATGSECAEPPECCVDCQIDEVTAVTIGDGSTSSAIRRKSDCCWDADMEGGAGGDRTVEVCYLGNGQWKVENETIGGDCNGATDGGVDPTSVTASGSTCQTADCCGYGPGAGIELFSAQNGVVVVSSNGPHEFTSSGDCSASVTFTATAFDGMNQTDATVTISLRYDAGCGQGGGCVWDVSISHDPLPGGDANGSAVAAEGCVGPMTCRNACGDCKDFDTDVNFEVVAPGGSTGCTGPAISRRRRVSFYKDPRDERPGDMLRKLHPEIFKTGCGNCSDIQNLMNRYGIEKSRTEANRFAQSLHATGPNPDGLTVAELQGYIMDACDAEEQRIQDLPT